MSDYRYTKVNIGDEVQVNDNFILLFNPPQHLIDSIFIILDIQGNALEVDKNIFDNFKPKNILLRMWIKPYENPILNPLKKKEKKKNNTVKIPDITIADEVTETVVEPSIQIKPAVKEIKYKSKKKSSINQEIVNDFFTIE